MAFMVEDVRDLVRLLEEHPEWRAEIRRLVLTEELLAVPDRLDRIDAVLERISERLDQLTVIVRQLAEAQARSEIRMARAEDRIGYGLGVLAELRYRARGGAYFSRLARRVRAMDSGVLADMLLDAVEAGTIGEEERQTILLADLVFTARRLDGSEDIYLLVEVSHGVGPEDVTRALHRARLLERLGRPVLPVVAGESIADDTAAVATAAGVWQVLDGRVVPPAA